MMPEKDLVEAVDKQSKATSLVDEEREAMRSKTIRFLVPYYSNECMFSKDLFKVLDIQHS